LPAAAAQGCAQAWPPFCCVLLMPVSLAAACLAMPHLIHTGVGVITALVLMAVTMGLVSSTVSHDWQQRPNVHLVDRLAGNPA
jgi:hypothetical protein